MLVRPQCFPTWGKYLSEACRSPAIPGVPSGFRLGIYDRNGATPGDLLQSLTGTESSGSGVSTFQSSGLALQPNSEYFIVATATTPLASGAFQWDITSWVDQAQIFEFRAGGILYSSPDGQAWDYSRPNNFMFAVNATVVPEPSASAMLLGGSLVFALSFLRRRKWRLP